MKMYKVLLSLALLASSSAYAADSVSTAGGSSFSNPAVGNFDGNPANGLELVAASSNGTIQAFSQDLTLLWSTQSPNINCSSGGNRIHSSPAVYDLSKDGIDDVVIGYGGPGSERCDGGIIAINGKDGSRIFTFSLKAFAKKKKFGTISHSVFATPAISDVEGDGTPEIAFGSYDRNFYFLNADGTVRWYYNAADSIWSSPAFADINGDGRQELIVSTDISGNKRLVPPTKDGGLMYAFDTKTRKGARIGFRQKGAYYWQTAFDQVLYSSPVVAELVASNPGPEIAIASGCFFPQNSRDKRGKWVKIISAKTGRVLTTISTQSCTSGSVAVGDLFGMGTNSVVHFAAGNLPGADGKSRLTAFNPETGATLWSVVPEGSGRNVADAGSFQSPAIADMDNDGAGDVLLSHAGSVVVIKGSSGQKLACANNADSNCRDGEIVTGFDLSRNSPLVADLGGINRMDLVVSRSSGSSGTLRVYRDVNARYTNFDPDARSGLVKVWWGGWRGVSDRSGIPER